MILAFVKNTKLNSNLLRRLSSHQTFVAYYNTQMREKEKKQGGESNMYQCPAYEDPSTKTRPK